MRRHRRSFLGKRLMKRKIKKTKKTKDLRQLSIIIIMDPVSRSFDRTPIPINRDRGTNHTKIKGSCQEMAKENFIPGEEEVNWNQNPHATPISSISLKSKTPDLLIKFK